MKEPDQFCFLLFAGNHCAIPLMNDEVDRVREDLLEAMAKTDKIATYRGITFRTSSLVSFYFHDANVKSAATALAEKLLKDADEGEEWRDK